MSFRLNRRSSPEKEGAENWEAEKMEREELQQEEEEDEESGKSEDEEEAGVEKFTLVRFSDLSQSIAAEITSIFCMTQLIFLCNLLINILIEASMAASGCLNILKG